MIKMNKFTFIFISIVFLYCTSLYSQENGINNISFEITEVSEREKEAINKILETYKKLTKEDDDFDIALDFDYVLNVFPKIKSIRRIYSYDKSNEKYIIVNKAIFKSEEYDNYFNLEVTFSPFLSVNSGFINIEITNIAAMASIESATFVLSVDILEIYSYFSNSGGAHSINIFRVNGIEKYKVYQDWY